MAVSNPLYKRLQGGNNPGGSAHPTRTRIPVDPFIALVHEVGRGALTANAANTIIGQLAATQDQDGNPITQALDATESQQATDLFNTINSLSGANQALRLTVVKDVLNLLEIGGITAYGPDDMAGATVGAVGGKLGVARRDSP